VTLSEEPGKKVLLIPSRELGWGEVRKALTKMKEVSQVQSAKDLPEAVNFATSAHPDAVIFGPVVDTSSDANQLAELHRICGPEAPMVVIASDFDVNLVLRLGYLGITGYLLWADLTVDCLARCLGPAVIDGVMIGSRTVGRAAIAAAQHRITSPVDPGILTDAEQTVLCRLSQGLTESEIAVMESVSERSLRRTITSAKQKLGAPILFVLGMTFMRLPIAHNDGVMASP
jgi:DNA-binding NarL/FixJ family response regulator